MHAALGRERRGRAGVHEGAVPHVGAKRADHELALDAEDLAEMHGKVGRHPPPPYGDVQCAGQRRQAHVSTRKASSVVP